MIDNSPANKVPELGETPMHMDREREHFSTMPSSLVKNQPRFTESGLQLANQMDSIKGIVQVHSTVSEDRLNNQLQAPETEDPNQKEEEQKEQPPEED